MSPAAVVRAHLAEARERGEPFARAWHDAMDALALEAPDAPERADQRRERECWARGLALGRAALPPRLLPPAPGAQGKRRCGARGPGGLSLAARVPAALEQLFRTTDVLIARRRG